MGMDRTLQQLAEAGDCEAQFEYASEFHADAMTCQNGSESEEKYRQAAEWMRKAAEQGHHLAAGIIGEMLRSGQGVPMDKAEAVAWFRRGRSTGTVFLKHGSAEC